VTGTPLTGANISTLRAHLNTTHPGEIDTYAEALPGLLPGFLTEAGALLGARLAMELAEGVERAIPAEDGKGRGDGSDGGEIPLRYSKEETITAMLEGAVFRDWPEGDAIAADDKIADESGEPEVRIAHDFYAKGDGTCQ
jgi:hypothetical protein